MKKFMIMLGCMVLAAACVAQVATNRIAAMTKKLDSIVIPVVFVKDSSVLDVVQFLQAVSKDHDAEKTGVNIVVTDLNNKAKITLNMKRASLHTILKITAEMAGLSLDIGGDAVVLRKQAIKP